MLRRLSLNFAIFSMVLDVGLTYLAFATAIWLRLFISSLTLLTLSSLYSIDIPSWLYVAIPIL